MGSVAATGSDANSDASVAANSDGSGTADVSCWVAELLGICSGSGVSGWRMVLMRVMTLATSA
jgi:hypothetical protein